MKLADAYQIVGSLGNNIDKPIYTQKQVDEMLKEVGVLTGSDAEIFLDNIENRKELSPEVKERMKINYNKFK